MAIKSFGLHMKKSTSSPVSGLWSKSPAPLFLKYFNFIFHFSILYKKFIDFDLMDFNKFS